MNPRLILEPLSSSLVELGFIDQSMMRDLAPEWDDRDLADHLLEKGYLTHHQLAKGVAMQAGLPYTDLREVEIDQELFDLLPLDVCNRLNVVPLSATPASINIVITDPFDVELQQKVEFLCRRHAKLHVAELDSIRFALSRCHERHDALKDLADGMRLEIVIDSGDENRTLSLEEYGELSSSPIVRLINTVILSALKKRASDVHVEVYEYGVEVKYRIDGVLYPATEMLDRSYHASLISRLKVMAELDIAEKKVPQDGRFKLRVKGRNIDFRLSIIPSAYGENAVIRVLDSLATPKAGSDLSLDRLGISPEQLKSFRKAIHEPYGMVLIAGPTGSGKTTTIYGALSELNTGQEKIITIEDPVEYQLDGVMQIAVNEKKGLTFSSGLRAVLRHDPDKILVGEIRDVETASIAVQSALTGHLVFSSVHANNAIDVISRFQNMGVDTFNFLSSLNCVMAQRLVRVLCRNCKVPHRYERTFLSEVGLGSDDLDNTFYRAVGCEYCDHTGYRGRTSICEVLVVTDDVRHLISEKGSTFEVLKNSELCGGITLRRSALERAVQGVTSLEEVNRVTFVE